MADAAWVVTGPDDATLLNTVRTGDDAAFEVLYKRHVHAVRLLAHDLVTSPAEADHLVAETFALVLGVTKRGGGPTDAFRPYMLTALRRVAASQVRDQGPSAEADNQELAEPGEPFLDATVAAVAASLIARTFLSLPERWQAVLWHTEIEQADPAGVAPLFGLGADGVRDLARRASEGLQQAYLRLHIPSVTRADCRPVAERIGAHLRGTLSRRSAALVTEHLASCGECAAVFGELADLGAALRSQVAPVYLGGATAAYLAGISSAAAANLPATPAVADGPADAAPATALLPAAEAEATGHRLPRTSGPRWVAAGAGAVLVVAGVTLAVALTGHGAPDPRTHHAAGPRASLSAGVSAGQPQPSATAGKRAKPSRAPRTSPASAASPSPNPSPAPAAQLSAAVSVAGPQGRGNFAQVTFTASDTGNAATGTITASISLPSGSRFMGAGGHFGGQNGWTCQQDGSGASCQHGGISAGAEAQGTIFIMIGQSSCGQPVELTVTSGAASASAQSGDIQCSGGPG